MKINDKTVTLNDILERPVPVKVAGDMIGFPDYSYWIDLDRIETPEALIQWIHHLTGKNWITNSMIEGFIDGVCTHNSWEVYGHD